MLMDDDDHISPQNDFCIGQKTVFYTPDNQDIRDFGYFCELLSLAKVGFAIKNVCQFNKSKIV
jgi:hypothetical protein